MPPCSALQPPHGPRYVLVPVLGAAGHEHRFPSRSPDEVTVGRGGWRRRTGGRSPPSDGSLGRIEGHVIRSWGVEGSVRPSSAHVDVTCCARAPPPRTNPGIPRKDPHETVPLVETKATTNAPLFWETDPPKGGIAREAPRLPTVQGGRRQSHENWDGRDRGHEGKARNARKTGVNASTSQPNGISLSTWGTSTLSVLCYMDVFDNRSYAVVVTIRFDSISALSLGPFHRLSLDELALQKRKARTSGRKSTTSYSFIREPWRHNLTKCSFQLPPCLRVVDMTLTIDDW